MTATPRRPLFAAEGSPLLSGLELRRDQTYLIDARDAHDVDGMRHLRENDSVVALDESDLFGAQLEDIVQPRPEVVPRRVCPR